MAVQRLAYFSSFGLEPGRGYLIRQLNDILRVSNRNNQTKGITGALIFDMNWFVQVLEGDRDVVWSVFQKIERDERHRDVKLVEFVTVPGRYFGNWWMGCAEFNEDLAATFRPYLRNGQFHPPDMSALEILSLMVDLSLIGYTRELAH